MFQRVKCLIGRHDWQRDADSMGGVPSWTCSRGDASEVGTAQDNPLISREQQWMADQGARYRGGISSLGGGSW